MFVFLKIWLKQIYQLLKNCHRTEIYYYIYYRKKKKVNNILLIGGLDLSNQPMQPLNNHVVDNATNGTSINNTNNLLDSLSLGMTNDFVHYTYFVKV